MLNTQPRVPNESSTKRTNLEKFAWQEITFDSHLKHQVSVMVCAMTPSEFTVHEAQKTDIKGENVITAKKQY